MIGRGGETDRTLHTLLTEKDENEKVGIVRYPLLGKTFLLLALRKLI